MGETNKPVKRYTMEIKKFLMSEFEKGMETNLKENPDDVSKRIRTERDAVGKEDLPKGRLAVFESSS